MSVETFFIGEELRTDTVPARPGLYASFQYCYRLATAEKLKDYFRTLRMNQDANEFKLETKLIQDHLASWTIKDKTGEILPVTKDLLEKMHPSIRTRLVSIISGFTVPGGDETEAVVQE